MGGNYPLLEKEQGEMIFTQGYRDIFYLTCLRDIFDLPSTNTSPVQQLFETILFLFRGGERGEDLKGGCHAAWVCI